MEWDHILIQILVGGTDGDLKVGLLGREENVCGKNRYKSCLLYTQHLQTLSRS